MADLLEGLIFSIDAFVEFINSGFVVAESKQLQRNRPVVLWADGPEYLALGAAPQFRNLTRTGRFSAYALT